MKDGFEYLRSVALCDAGQYDNATDCMDAFGRPVNVTVSPNGKTVLVANAEGGAIFVFEIKGGELLPGNPFILTGLPGGPMMAETEATKASPSRTTRPPMSSHSAIICPNPKSATAVPGNAVERPFAGR